MKLEHLEILSSHTVEAWLENFDHYLTLDNILAT